MLSGMAHSHSNRKLIIIRIELWFIIIRTWIENTIKLRSHS